MHQHRHPATWRVAASDSSGTGRDGTEPPGVLACTAGPNSGPTGRKRRPEATEAPSERQRKQGEPGTVSKSPGSGQASYVPCEEAPAAYPPDLPHTLLAELQEERGERGYRR